MDGKFYAETILMCIYKFKKAYDTIFEKNLIEGELTDVHY